MVYREDSLNDDFLYLRDFPQGWYIGFLISELHAFDLLAYFFLCIGASMTLILYLSEKKTQVTSLVDNMAITLGFSSVYKIHVKNPKSLKCENQYIYQHYFPLRPSSIARIWYCFFPKEPSVYAYKVFSKSEKRVL